MESFAKGNLIFYCTKIATHGSTLLFEPMPGTIPVQNLVNLLGGPNSDWTNYLPVPIKTEATRLSSIQ